MNPHNEFYNSILKLYSLSGHSCKTRQVITMVVDYQSARGHSIQRIIWDIYI